MASPTPARVLIIGGGPAGLTAALYTSRALLQPVVLASLQAGGQLMLTTEVENYPGFPQGVLGPELMQKFREQSQRFGAKIHDVDATRVDFKTRPLRVWADEAEYHAEALIIATGASAKWLGVPGEERLRGTGVSSCATCDGAFFKDRELLVAGGGDSAMEEAAFLTRFATRVTIVHRRDTLRASRIMQERARKNPKIGFLWNSTIEEILGDQKVTGARIKNLKTGKTETRKCDGVFVAIGHEPNTAIFQGQLDMDDKGYIKIHQGTRTSIEGVFAAGDVHDPRYRQAVTAAGAGCMAALDAEKWLAERE